MKINTLSVFALVLLMSCAGVRKPGDLRKQIENYTKTKKAIIGVSVYLLEDGDTITVANAHHYPMQSVYKFHLALAILNKIDQGKLSISQKIHIKKEDLLPETHSPLRDKYPNGNIDMALSELLTYSVSQSDNNACDILFNIIGGPKNVNNYIHQLGLSEIEIAATEDEMHKKRNVQYQNWSKPFAATLLLKMFYRDHILSKESFNFLWEAMVKSSNATDRIKGQLPAGAVVAHKTGTSGSDENGVSAATNDIGIITLPNGKHLAIAIFVSDSKEEEKENAIIIAHITKLSYDYFSK